MKVLTRKDVNRINLWKFLAYGWLPIPKFIIPPERPFYLWDNLNVIPYDPAGDYNGKLLDQVREAIARSLKGWEPLDRIGVWLSGGIDSSLLIRLTSDIVGPEKVRAYSLSFGQRDETELAKRIADWCDVRLVVKEMTPDDSIELTREAVSVMRAPVDSTPVLFISKLCRKDGTDKVFSALGLDELMAGYPAHVNATDKDFPKVETDLLWRCQSNYVWIQLLQGGSYIDVRFPYLDQQLIAFCRGLPRSQKCSGRETKLRVRKELKDKSLIPEETVEAGRIAGTKGGFIPILEDWFKRGYDDWCGDNIPANGIGLVDRLVIRFLSSRGRTLEGRLQRRLRVAALNTLYSLLDEGKYVS